MRSTLLIVLALAAMDAAAEWTPSFDLRVRGLFSEVRSIINVFFRGAISKNMQMLHTEYLPRQAWDAAGRTPRFHPGCSLAGGVLECGRGCQGSDRPLH